MLYERRDFRETLREVTGGAGLPVVYESVGKDTFQRSLECLRPRGILANFGHASGPPDLVELIELGTRGLLWVTRPTIMTYMEDRDDMLARMPDYLERFQTFYAHRPHPAVVNVPGVEAWTKLPAFVVKFTDLRHHVSEHERFAQTVRRYKQQFDADPDSLNTDNLLNTLKNWITGHIRHILKSDREMIPYLRGEK